MALVDKTRIPKQSHCAFIYGLIKGFYQFLSNKKLSKLFECNSLNAETVFTRYSKPSSSRCYKVTDFFDS